jgi:hypothetical protein
MDPTPSDMDLIAVYDNHTITIPRDGFEYISFKGKITGPVYNSDIRCQLIGSRTENEDCFCGNLDTDGVNIQFVIASDESFDPSGIVAKIAMPNVAFNISTDDMDTCVFSEVMPMKGVHDG